MIYNVIRNQSEQALQIIGHVVADSMQISSQMLLYYKSYLMNFGRWNYDCAFYYYYLIMKKMYKTHKSNILHL
jgi:hypothetical protein